MTLIEEGDNQDDEADILVVTETMPATARMVGQGAEGQGALVRNILEAEKALQAWLAALDPDYEGSQIAVAAAILRMLRTREQYGLPRWLLGLLTSTNRCCVC